MQSQNCRANEQSHFIETRKKEENSLKISQRNYIIVRRNFPRGVEIISAKQLRERRLS